MDDDTKNSFIDDFIKKSFTPTKRSCMVCDKEFVGSRNVCSDKCHFALQARVAYNRSLRPRDYQSSARKTFLVEDLPKCPVCRKEYIDLQKHCSEMGGDEHTVLLVHSL